MDNLRIVLSLVDGSAIVHDEPTGQELIEALFGPDIVPPTEVLVIDATAEDGTRVTIRVPFDDRSQARVPVERPDDG